MSGGTTSAKFWNEMCIWVWSLNQIQGHLEKLILLLALIIHTDYRRPEYRSVYFPDKANVCVWWRQIVNMKHSFILRWSSKTFQLSRLTNRSLNKTKFKLFKNSNFPSWEKMEWFNLCLKLRILSSKYFVTAVKF